MAHLFISWDEIPEFTGYVTCYRREPNMYSAVLGSRITREVGIATGEYGYRIERGRVVIRRGHDDMNLCKYFCGVVASWS